MLHESEEMKQVRSAVLDVIEELQAAKQIVFPETVAERTYVKLDKSYRAPHLVQFIGLDRLKMIGAQEIRNLDQEEALDLETRQAQLIDLTNYQLQSGYSGERCFQCQAPRWDHFEKNGKPRDDVDHEYLGRPARIPLQLCFPEELWREGERMIREGNAKIKHGKAIHVYVLNKFPDFDSDSNFKIQ